VAARIGLIPCQRRAKRGGGRLVGASDLAGAEGGDEGGLDQFIGIEPSPEFAALVAEEYRRRLDALGDEVLPQVAVMRMEGYTDEEIARRLGCTQRTVCRKLNLIRQEWREESEE
jgi:DNA-directed RNA polymerase specialized sigma24 family protein